MAIARQLIVEGSRSSVSNGEPDHAVQQLGFHNAPAKYSASAAFGAKQYLCAITLVYPNIVYAPR
jgi:hypothetical protein